MKVLNLGISLCLLVVLTSCGQREKRVETSPESKAIKIKVMQISASSGNGDLRYSGSIEPSQTIPLSFQNVGTVKDIYVEEGDFVKKGTLLASIDNKDMKNMYEIARSKYMQAKDAYDRLKTVYEQGSLTEIKWVEMETNLEQARSSLELAKSNLEKCDLYAPADGVIGKRNTEPGQSSISGLGAPLELVKIEKVFVKISVPENEINKIQKGQKAGFQVAALNGKQFLGTITNVSPVADAISRTYNAKITVANPGFELKPGMVCDVSFNSNISDNKILAPYSAVSAGADGKPFVFVITADKNRVMKRQITTGSYVGSMIEVTAGLANGETIVVEGKEKLSDNSLISY